MASIVVAGDTSGAVTIAAPAVAGTNTITLPATTGTAVLTGVSGNIDINAAGANNLTLSTNSTERMRVTSTGNVGIGTNSPTNPIQTYRLGEYSSSSNNIRNLAYFQADTTIANSSIIFNTNPSSGQNLRGFRFGYQSSEFSITRFHTDKTTGVVNDLTVDSSGNVGIGATPSAWATIAPGLDVGTCGGLASFTNQTLLSYNLFYNGSNFIYKTSSQGATYRMVNGEHYWETSVSGTAGAAATVTQRMRLDINGQLGLGVNPTSNVRLYVQGQTATTNNWAIYALNSNSVGMFGIRNDNYFFAPSIGNYSTGGTALYYDGGGYVGLFSSSLRYKKDIRDYDKGLDAIAALRPVYYKAKNTRADGTVDDNQYAGLIAEEVDAAGFNEFVVYDEEGRPNAVQYQNMIALMTKAIQELNAKVEAQAAEIAVLKGVK